jgi:hypothetical protein
VARRRSSSACLSTKQKSFYSSDDFLSREPLEENGIGARSSGLPCLFRIVGEDDAAQPGVLPPTVRQGVPALAPGQASIEQQEIRVATKDEPDC